MLITCPKCLKDDQVQKVSLLFSSTPDSTNHEISDPNSSGTLELSEDRFLKKLTPPPLPENPGNQFAQVATRGLIFGLLGGIIGFVLFVAVLIMLDMSDSIGFFFLYVCPGTGFVVGAIIGGTKASQSFDQQYSVYHHQRMKLQTWENLYYCTRDHLLFNPQMTTSNPDDLFELFRVSDDESKNGRSNGEALQKFIAQLNATDLEKPANHYLDQGIAYSKESEFDSAILEFVKVIKLSTPEDETHQAAKKELRRMGFSESDIRHIYTEAET